MIKKLRTTLMAALLLTSLAAPVVYVAPVVAQEAIKSNLCDGAELTFTSGEARCAAAFNAKGECINSAGAKIEANQCTTEDKLNSLVANIVNILSVIVGIIAVIMIIIGGLKYITSSGDSGNVQSAKNTILYAVVGLIIVALAQVIVRFVLNKVGTS